MEFKIQQHEAFHQALVEYKSICEEFNQVFKKDHDYFEEYCLSDAGRVVVVMGSTAGTVKDAVDRLRARGEKVGMLRIKLFRPFPHEAMAKALANARNIAVLDRAISLGAYPPLYQEIVSTLYGRRGLKPEVRSFVYGLGGRDTFEKDIENIFSELKMAKTDNKIRFIC